MSIGTPSPARACRCCGSLLEHPFLDLGTSPPSQSHVRPDQLDAPEVFFPLRVFVCSSCFLVQLPEPLSLENQEQAAGAKLCQKLKRPLNIAELTKERVRRAITAVEADSTPTLQTGDRPGTTNGFRVFKLDRSCFESWDANTAKDGESLQTQIFKHVEHMREGRSESDLLYEILLKSGFPLTTVSYTHLTLPTNREV